MRTLLLSLWLVLCLLASAGASAQKRRRQRVPCGDLGTQAEMNLCADREFRARDAALNRIYKQILAKLDPAEQDECREVGRAWLTYRDANCRFQAAVYEGGTIQPLVRAMCLTRLTESRIEDLKVQLDELSR